MGGLGGGLSPTGNFTGGAGNGPSPTEKPDFSPLTFHNMRGPA